jgi:LmbE family N-acetylglucosaminyl deacetylase
MYEMKNVLVMGAHPDDIEFGMGATVSRFKREGKTHTKFIVFSNCDSSLPVGFKPGTLVDECKESLSVYGVGESEIVFHDFPVRNFDLFRQDILDVIVREYRADLFDSVFFPASSDTHQDHSILSQEAIRACKNSTMLGYEMSWNAFGSKKNYFVEVTEEDLSRKVKSIKKYASQENRVYSSENAQKSFAISSGIEIGKKYAEGFELIRGICPT